MVQHLRVARHTNNLEKIKNFYVKLLGFEILTTFENHQGYSGIMIGDPEHSWHFEFTKSDESPDRTNDPDDLIVLYFDDPEDYQQKINKLVAHNSPIVESKNPYWDNYGKTFLDPDGFRVVLVNRKW
jgi:predicted lactoylglutathione lyase